MHSSTFIAILSALASFVTASISHAASPPRHTDGLTSPHPAAGVSVGVPHLELAQAHQDLDFQLAQADHPAVNVNRKTIASSGGYTSLNHAVVRNQATQPLLLLTRELDGESQTQLREDLLVMSRILDKAAQTEVTSTRGPRAMGIELVLGTGPSPARNLYIDDFGAVFMLNVEFPLLASAATDDTDSNEQSTETIWEQTRQEMYGGSPSDANILTFVGNPTIAEVPPYDEERVEALRSSLLEAVKNATNIRHLADHESVMIYVTGASLAGDQRVRMWRKETSSKGEQIARELALTHRPASGDIIKASRAVMTIQASKADIDRFARGDLSLDQFREQARTRIYLGPASSDWNPSGFLWTNN